MKPIAWYDPTNGVVSTDKDSPLFTPLGQVWPLYPQPEQEPVAWVCHGVLGKLDIDFEEADINKLPIGTLLYTAPAQRTWVNLTDEHIDELMNNYDVALLDYARAIEAKLKEKNT